MPATVEDQKKIARQQQSWLLAALFAGLGTGFILFWVTLAVLYASIICGIISLVVWPLSRGRWDSNFATKAVITFFVATVIGVLVGLGTTVGTGLPLSGP